MLLAEPGLKMRWLSSLLWSCVCKALCIRAVYQSQILECSRGLASSPWSLLLIKTSYFLVIFLLIAADHCRGFGRSTNTASLNFMYVVITMAYGRGMINELLLGRQVHLQN